MAPRAPRKCSTPPSVLPVQQRRGEKVVVAEDTTEAPRCTGRIHSTTSAPTPRRPPPPPPPPPPATSAPTDSAALVRKSDDLMVDAGQPFTLQWTVRNAG